MILERVVSGGQTGVDQSALRAARRLGIATGGWAPRGWRTLDGPAPWLAEFGLREHARENYGSRTAANVRDSDATVRIARSFCTPGERCTLRAIEKHKRPRLDVPLLHLEGHGLRVLYCDADGERLREFLAENRVRVLNVAGNSERSAPGIGALVEEFLLLVLARREMRYGVQGANYSPGTTPCPRCGRRSHCEHPARPAA